MGLGYELILLVQSRFKLTQKEEWITTGGFIITYCILARSQAQLPHYIFIVFPLAAIVTAKFLYKLVYTEQFKIWRRILTIMHVIIYTFLWVAVIILLIYPFESIPKYVAGIAAICLVVMYFLLTLKKAGFPKLLEVSFFTVIGVNIFLNTAFYPTLLQFQLGNTVADIINNKNLPKENVFMYGVGNDYALHFYGNHIFQQKVSIASMQPTDYLITAKDSLPIITQKFPKNKVLYSGRSYGVTQLTKEFLNPATRESTVDKYVIVKLVGEN